MRKLLHLIPFILLCVASIQSEATHIMGGNTCYSYLGYNSITNTYQYEITVYLYRDMSGIDCPTNVTFNVYNNNPPTYSSVTSVTLNSISMQVVNPIPVQCPFNLPIDVQECVYQGTVDLPPSLLGYFMIHTTCCRNALITNILSPLNAGFTFYSIIPPTFYNNSSPCFNEIPVPYMCANDTTTMDNSAYDVDGDLLIFKFVTPYDDGNVVPPLNDTVLYNPGYSATNPFGPGGVALINASTGITTLYAPNIGYYVIAIEIQEYRNGILLSTVRRDLQIIVINCPPQATPVFTDTSGATINGPQCVSYSVNEGDTLCFPILYEDPDGDSVYLQIVGDIFDGSQFNPPATCPEVNGLGSAQTEFCWETYCGVGSITPYYFFAIVKDNGCPPKSNYLPFCISVIPELLEPDLILGPQVVCAGQSGVIYSVGDTTLNYNYSWQVLGGTISSGMNGESITVNWGPTGFGNVSVIRNDGCETDTLNLFVNIYPAADAVVPPQYSICFGAGTILNGSGSTGLIYSWIPTTGLSNPNIAQPYASPSVTATYSLIVSNNLQCPPDTAITTVIVHPLPVIDLGADQSFCVGISVQLNPNAGGAYTYVYTPPNGLSNPNIGNPSASPSDTITYILTATDLFGCQSNDTITLNVGTPEVFAGFDLTICIGDIAQINAQASNAATYLWLPATGLSATNIPNPTAQPAVTTTYTLTVTDVNGCTDSDEITINVSNTTLIAAAIPDTSICSGETITLWATGGNNYLWSPATGLSSTTVQSPDANPVSTTIYMVIVSSGVCQPDTAYVTVAVNPLPIVNAGFPSVTICLGDSIQMVGTGATTYWWSPNVNITDQSISNPFVFPTSTTTYSLLGTNANGCENTDQIIVNVNSISVLAGYDTILCLLESTTLIAVAPGAVSYSWSPTFGLNNPNIQNPIATPFNTTTYTVTATDAAGCQGTDTVHIDIYTTIPVTILQPDTIFICQGEATQLNATSTVSATFQWTPSTGLSDPNIDNPMAFPSTTTTYTVLGTTTSGSCTGTDIVTIDVSPSPILSVDATDSVCAGQSATIYLISDGSYDYLWSNGETDSVFTVTPVGGEIYTVTATNSIGCSTTAGPVSVTVVPNPVVDISELSVSIKKGESYPIDGSVVNYAFYTWTPSTFLNDDISQDPIATPDQNITYTLYAENALGCSDADTIHLIVLPPPIFDVPNAFTPNGDGLNDNFTIHAEEFASIKFIIFNRWGEKVYETFDVAEAHNIGWDGNFKGRDQELGVYVYYIEGTAIDGTEIKAKGNITLIK